MLQEQKSNEIDSNLITSNIGNTTENAAAIDETKLEEAPVLERRVQGIS